MLKPVGGMGRAERERACAYARCTHMSKYCSTTGISSHAVSVIDINESTAHSHTSEFSFGMKFTEARHVNS